MGGGRVMMFAGFLWTRFWHLWCLQVSGFLGFSIYEPLFDVAGLNSPNFIHSRTSF